MWAAEIHLDLLGTAFAVQCTSREVADQVSQLLSAFVSRRTTAVPARRWYGLVDSTALAERGDGDRVIAFRDCRRLGPPETIGMALTRLVASLNRAAIAEYDGFAVHAGVVTFGDRAVALPASSGMGKSTLTVACLQAGMAYASDEALCVELTSGVVVSYPKPISLGERSLDLLRIDPAILTVPVSDSEGLALPSDLGASLAKDRTTLAHVVLAQFGHKGPELEEVAASEAMAALLKLSFNHYKLGEAAFHLAASLAVGAQAWRLVYDDPREAGVAIAALG